MSIPAVQAPDRLLAETFAAWAALAPEAEADLAGIFVPWHCAPEEQVVPVGADLQRVLFVSRGLLRFYTVDEAGREWNKGFVVEGGLTGPLSADAPGWPAPHGLQALEEVQGLQAPAAEFHRLRQRHGGLDAAVRRLLAGQLAHKGARLESLQRLDGAARYREFLQQSPELASRLAQYHIASYLGVSEVGLSRIRAGLGMTRG